MYQDLNSLKLGMAIPPLMGNPYNETLNVNPYYRVDDNP